MNREEYFAQQKEFFKVRSQQVAQLLEEVGILKGDSMISIGCGVAADLVLLDRFKDRWGIDINPSVIDFCKKTHHHIEFVLDNWSSALEKVPDQSIDLIIALDIDSNIFPDMLVQSTLNKLSDQGMIILTERNDNKRIYGRLLLHPPLQRIRKICEKKAKVSYKQKEGPMDNHLVIIKK